MRRLVPDSAGERAGALGRIVSLGDTGGEALRLVLAYVKQETVGPLRGVARFVAFGLVGSVALSGGAVLLLLALLRVLQDETGTTFAGSRSWLPYVVVVVAGLVVMGLAAWRVVSGPARRGTGSSGSTGSGEEA